MTRIYFLLVALLVGFSVQAQEMMEDLVYLKDGAIIRGVILEQSPEMGVKIRSRDNVVAVFPPGEIQRVTRVKALDTYGREGSEFKQSGYFGKVEVMYGFSTENEQPNAHRNDNDDSFLGFRIVNGQQFNPHLSVGIGIGMEKYGYATLLPITLDLNAALLKGRVSPVAGFSIRNALALNNVRSGLQLSPSLGLKVFTSGNTAFLFNVAYKSQDARALYLPGYYNYFNPDRKKYFHFVTFSTEFSF